LSAVIFNYFTEMLEVIGFLGFYLISWWVLMQIFRLTTYHAYFWKALPLLIGYGVLVGWLMFWMRYEGGFFWMLLFLLVSFIFGAVKAKRLGTQMVSWGEAFSDNLPNITEVVAKSALNSLFYYIISAIVFFIAFSSSFLFFYNK